MKSLSLVFCLSAAASLGAPQDGGSPIEYEVSFENAAHHESRISVTYRGIGTSTLELRMARSSPGRYAIHEFAKAHGILGFKVNGAGGAAARSLCCAGMKRVGRNLSFGRSRRLPRHSGTSRSV